MIKSILLTTLMALPVLVYSQQWQGHITDEQGAPIPNAYIINKSSNAHAHSNDLGFFKLNGSQAGDSIFVSHIGFETVLFIADTKVKDVSLQLKEMVVQLEQMVVTPDLETQQQIAQVDLVTNPVNSSQEILRKVPGLFIGQHAGGGKAEQIFLRGFDIDHGTDVNISVDGLPVNMVSHAHGQGYADLHFLIPETIDNIAYGKGPYDANKGDFATAGYVDFKTYDRLESNLAAVEIGSFNRLRTVGMFNLLDSVENKDAYIAGEYYTTDGPFNSPQNFNRINLMGKYSARFKKQTIQLQASYFDSKWDASGQIPERAVASGLIDRFGAIDDTEGGQTGRINLLAKHSKLLNDNTIVNSKAYFTHYDFELYSNFTFYLNDSINGDQIKQKETRNIIGYETNVYHNTQLGGFNLGITSGIGFRYDNIDNIELSHTLNRQTTLETYMLGDIDESNLYAFTSAEFQKGKWMINPSLRLDYFKFDYYDKLAQEYSTQSQQKSRLSPKLNITYSPNNNLQWYLKSGIGFHSNDARVVVAQDGEDILPAAYGSDLGLIYKPTNNLMINAALWYLHLQQEFVYVGDEGVVEPSGRTARKGIDIGLRYQPLSWLYLDTDLNYAHARSLDEEDGNNYIPLAPSFTSTGGISLQHPSGLSAGLRYRYLHDRPANEDNSVTAEGYFITDANVGYKWKNLSLNMVVENIFDTDWYETQFYTTSQLLGETSPVSEIHYTPGSPINFRIKAAISF
ncbi:TonB-dependent receptor [Chondrinema litorale]|uniref:TonB-dependent receptor n=1 Tax=Chondrinema litorale TaxID=2994555 RepID=UPI0025432A93|nr:TonB-dependent receptor plug domain-containing protein [Chondrinema litorale]UZR98539.1 TonB-dependent receptor plug domain-containing protein [Chondrinema litorale]